DNGGGPERDARAAVVVHVRADHDHDRAGDRTGDRAGTPDLTRTAGRSSQGLTEQLEEAVTPWVPAVVVCPTAPSFPYARPARVLPRKNRRLRCAVDGQACSGVEQVQPAVMHRQLDLSTGWDRPSVVEHGGEDCALVVGEQLPLVLVSCIARRAHGFGAYARRVDREDQVAFRT